MKLRIDKKSTADRTILDIEKLHISEVLVIGKYSYKKPFRKLYPEAFTNRYEFIYLESGRQVYFIDKARITLHGGEVLIIKPNQEHSTGRFFEERGIVYWLIGKNDFKKFLGYDKQVGREMLNSIMTCSPNQIIKTSKKFQSIIKHIFIEYKKFETIPSSLEKDICHARIKNNIFNLFLETYELSKKHNQNAIRWQIRKSIIYIHKNIKKKFSIPFLAIHVAQMSVSHFKRSFKEALGIPPGDYISLRKIAKAKAMLKDRSVTDTAFELDFSSSQYFATVFLKHTGRTPSEYKSQNL